MGQSKTTQRQGNTTRCLVLLSKGNVEDSIAKARPRKAWQRYDMAGQGKATQRWAMDCKGGATLRLASTGEGKAKTRVALFRDAKVRQRSVRPRCAKHCKCKGNRHYFYPLYAGKGEEDGEINRLRF